MADYLAAETGDLLDAENGDNIILDVAPLPDATSHLVIGWWPHRAPRAALHAIYLNPLPGEGELEPYPDSGSITVIGWRSGFRPGPLRAAALYRGVASAESAGGGGEGFKAAFARRSNSVLIAGSPV